jgi:hypothetical protein
LSTDEFYLSTDEFYQEFGAVLDLGSQPVYPAVGVKEKFSLSTP